MRGGGHQDSIHTLAEVAAGLAEGREPDTTEDEDYEADYDQDNDTEAYDEPYNDDSRGQQAGSPRVGAIKAVKRNGGKRIIHRRPVQFWSQFNDWWRGLYEGSGKRPTTAQIEQWYVANVATVWPDGGAPSLAEARTHAKCLRSVDSIRDYFRSYRARKKNKKEGVSRSRSAAACMPCRVAGYCPAGGSNHAASLKRARPGRPLPAHFPIFPGACRDFLAVPDVLAQPPRAAAPTPAHPPPRAGLCHAGGADEVRHVRLAVTDPVP